MTGQLQTAWQNAAQPFHHETVYGEDEVPLGQLQPFLKSLVRHLEVYYADSPLLCFEDWHQHDGYIVEAEKTSLATLNAHVESPDALLEWRHGDDDVYRAVYPESMDFLLRIYVAEKEDDQDEPLGVGGAFSFSGHGHDVNELKKRAHDIAGFSLKTEASKSYFNRIYAG